LRKCLFPPEFTQTEKGHGRIETRSIAVSTALNGYLKFPYVEQVVQIRRTRTILKTGKVEEESVFGITSLSTTKADPNKLAQYIRGHWSIENSLHYVRDFTFDEDRSQVRKNAGPRVMASLRNLAISLIRLKESNNIFKTLRFISRNQERALSFIGL
jgi:predicted transposase YbfD/YdcC